MLVLDKDLEEMVKGFNPNELKAILKQLKHSPVTPKTYKFGDKSVLFMVMSDYHRGNKCADVALLEYAAKVAKRRKVDFVLDGGDQCDGFYRDRPGHVFELNLLGADEQVEAVVNDYSQFGDIPILGITGNHTRNTFFNNAGYEIGKRLEERIPNFTFLGPDNGEIELAYGHKINVIHPDGGTAYALSYRPQKIAESLEGGTKPNILLISHYHKAEYLFYRNIHILQTGCLESQTDFMKGKSLAAMKGFFVVRADLNKGGITRFVPEFYPAY
jgi:hypothetical protein